MYATHALHTENVSACFSSPAPYWSHCDHIKVFICVWHIHDLIHRHNDTYDVCMLSVCMLCGQNGGMTPLLGLRRWGPPFFFFFFLFLATCDRCGCSCDFALSAYQSMAAATQPKQNRLFVKVVMISLKITSLPCWVVECSTGLMHNVSLYINEYILFVYIETVWKIEA